MWGWEEGQALCRETVQVFKSTFAGTYRDSNRAGVNLQPYPLGGTASSVRVQESSLVSRGSPGVFSRAFEVFDSDVL